MQCVVRGFLEMSAHKPHHDISRYREIFEKKSQLIDRKIRYVCSLHISVLSVLVYSKKSVNRYRLKMTYLV